MTELGAPVAYTAPEEGVEVLSSDRKRIGAVEFVLADENAAMFDTLSHARSRGVCQVAR